MRLRIAEANTLHVRPSRAFSVYRFRARSLCTSAGKGADSNCDCRAVEELVHALNYAGRAEHIKCRFVPGLSMTLERPVCMRPLKNVARVMSRALSQHAPDRRLRSNRLLDQLCA